MLIRIVERTTLLAAKVYGRKAYNCTILGDGKVHHWGTDFKEFKPATIVLNCVEPNEISALSLTEETH